MTELNIKLKGSFQPRNYSFGCSQTNDIATVTNWQVGNAKIMVAQTGIWFCFAKRKGSLKYSTVIITIDCGAAGGGTGELCQIYNLSPYIIQALPADGGSCIIQVLPPTILRAGTAPVETGLVNEIDEIEVTIPEFLNQIDFRFLGEFDTPLHPAPKFTDQRIVESVLKGRSFREQSTVGDIFKKGFTGIDYLLCKVGTEIQRDNYVGTFQGTLNIKRTSVIDGGPSYPQLNLGNSKTADEVMAISYPNYIAITNDYKSNIPKKFNGSASDLYQGRMVLFDIENGFNSINSADFVNRTLALFKAIKDGCGPDVKIGFMYQGAPRQGIGFGVMYSDYLAPEGTWTQVATMTANASAKNFPQVLLGKSFATIDNNLMAVIEYYLPYEAFAPEGSIFYSRTGAKLKDSSGVEMPPFTHFGAPQNVGGNANYKPSYLHPFAHTASALAVNKKFMPAERILILQTNLFNALTQFKDYGGTPDFAVIKQTDDGFAVYNIPNYIVAGIEAITFFSGAFYYLWEDATEVGAFVNRSLGISAKLPTVAVPDPPRRLDYRGQGAAQAMAKRLAVKVAMIDNVAYGFKDIIDGTEKYLLDNIEVDYLTVPNFSTVKKINPLNWMEFKLTPVMAIVNEAKGLIAIWTCPAFEGSGEPKTFDVYYRENTFNFKKRITATDYKNSLYIYKLNSSEIASPVTAPVISQNVTPTTTGQQVVLTSAGCGFVNRWYKVGNNSSIGTGSTITVSAENGVTFYALCENGTSKSNSSNLIVFSGLSVPTTTPTGVTITEPTKPVNFFTNGQPASFYTNRANLPIIFQNTSVFDATNDVVKMKNNEIEIWIDLKAGGQICYASLANSTKNLVYIGYDRGFQWQADYTQYLVGGKINGQSSGSPQNNVDYNTTNGGDFENRGVNLLESRAIEGGFYTKVRPLLYPFSAIISEVEIETTYRLMGSLLRVDYRYTSFRTDANIERDNPFRFKGFDLPVMFCLEEYSKYGVYMGDSPWQNLPLTEGDIPNTTEGASTALGFNTKERWGMIYNPNSNDAIGVYNASIPGTVSLLVFEVLNKYNSSTQGTNTTGPRTIMKMSKTIAIPNGSNFVDETTAYITFGSRTQVRNRFTSLHNQ